MSDEINDGLTDEERAALSINDDETPEEPVPGAEATADTKPAAEAAPAKTEDKPDATKPAPAADADTGGADTPAVAKQAADAATAAAPEPEAAPVAAAQPAPIFVAEAPADADANLANITSQKDALATKFDDGDITAKEYHAQLDALNKQEREIERAQDRARLANEMGEQQRMNAWFNQAQTFARDNGYTDPRRLNMLDAEVRAVAVAEPHLTGTDVLNKAHQNLVDAGLAVAKGAAKPAAAAAPAKGKPVELPPSIHKLPAADVDDTGAGEFAELDRLASTDPLKYEQALGKMSEAQRDRYLAA